MNDCEAYRKNLFGYAGFCYKCKDDIESVTKKNALLTVAISIYLSKSGLLRDHQLKDIIQMNGYPLIILEKEGNEIYLLLKVSYNERGILGFDYTCFQQDVKIETLFENLIKLCAKKKTHPYMAYIDFYSDDYDLDKTVKTENTYTPFGRLRFKDVLEIDIIKVIEAAKRQAHK